MAQRVTIKTIASDLGISHMTVSRALSGHPNVNEATREAVLKHAEELDYVRSSAAAAMRGEGTKIIGLLLPNIVNEFYARFANALALVCDARDQQLIIHLTNDDHNLEQRAILRLQQVQANAVIYVPSPRPDHLEPSRVSGMRLIQLLRSRPEVNATLSVRLNDGGAIRQAVQHLARSGHKTIGYIGGSEDLSSGRERLRAFRQGLAEAGLVELATATKTGAPSFKTGQDAAAQLLVDDQIEAVLCGGFELSNGALSTCLEHPRYQAGRFGYVGYGNPSFSRWIGNGIATINVPVEALVQATASFLSAEPLNTPTGAQETVCAHFTAP